MHRQIGKTDKVNQAADEQPRGTVKPKTQGKIGAHLHHEKSYHS